MTVIARIAPLLLLASLLAACGRDAPQEILGTVERDRLELVAGSNERIVEVAVREGEHVATGALLLVQEAGTAQPRIEQARASRDEAARRVADLVAGPRQRELEEARATLTGAQSTLATDQREYDRIRALVERKLLRARLELLREGTRTEQGAEARAALVRAEAALAEEQTVADRYSVRAPRAGVVEALPYELGERPAAGRPVAILLADGAPYARVYVPEPLRTRYVAGARVQVQVDGEAAAFAGTVRYISAEAAFTPYYSLTQRDRSRLAYLAEITLDDPAAQALPAGLPIQVLVPAATP
jgi:HlyD family secretion protein